MDGARPHALQAGQGRVHHVGAFGVDVAVKLGERRHGRRVAISECASRAGQEQPEHTRATEDEVFYLLSGQAVFRCGHARFDRAAPSTGTRPPAQVRFLVITAPAPGGGAPGWDAFAGRFEQREQPR